MAQFDLRLSGGRALLPGVGVGDVDILVADGKTAGFCQPGSQVDAAEIVDVSGLTVLPGAIDPHVHLGQAITFPKEPADFTKESAAAVAGGVTSFLVFLMGTGPYEGPVQEAVKLARRTPWPTSVPPLHQHARAVGVGAPLRPGSRDHILQVLHELPGRGGRLPGIPGNDDGFLYELLEAVRDNGSILCPHTENIEIVWRLRDRVKDMKGAALEVWNESRLPSSRRRRCSGSATWPGWSGPPSMPSTSPRPRPWRPPWSSGSGTTASTSRPLPTTSPWGSIPPSGPWPRSIPGADARGPGGAVGGAGGGRDRRHRLRP